MAAAIVLLFSKKICSLSAYAVIKICNSAGEKKEDRGLLVLVAMVNHVFSALVEACPRPTLIGWEAESESGGPASYFTLPPYWLSGEDGPFCGWTRFIHMNQIPYISHFTAGVMVK